MIRDFQDVVSYVAHEEEWASPRSALLARLAREHPWQDVRSGLGCFLQWLHVNLVRRRPEAMPVVPRFREIYLALLADSPELSRVFEISGDFLDYAATVPAAEQRQIEEYARSHYRPETRT